MRINTKPGMGKYCAHIHALYGESVDVAHKMGYMSYIELEKHTRSGDNKCVIW